MFSIQREIKATVVLGLVGLAAWFSLPTDGAARQPEHAIRPFCVTRAVKVNPNTKFNVRLVSSRKTVPLGGVIRFRIENHGTVDAAYSLPYRLQRRARNSWINQPVGSFFMPRLTLRSGSVGRCQAIHMTKSATPGIYRVSKEAWPAAAKHDRPRTVMRATFRVMS